MKRRRQSVWTAPISEPLEGRQLPGMERAVLAALTGWGQKDDRQKTARAGFDHHFVKPAESSELDTLLASISGVRVS